ncbi:MAG: hypothetical protein OCC49_18905 [Fibrobacterales bacterium]
MKLSHLFHIVDSSFPTGGFAFSSGMEAMARLGFITDRASFMEHLSVVLNQTTTSELPFIIAAFHNADSIETLRSIESEYSALTQIPTMETGSITAGAGWMYAIQKVFQKDQLDTIVAQLKNASITLHLTMALGISAAIIQLAEDELIELTRYMIVRDQVSAAVRLGLLGPTDGARSIHRALSIQSIYEIPHYTEAYRTAPMLELAQGAHHTLYSKLFQN